MAKIIMAGLYSIPNMGDWILCDAAKYLVRSFDDTFDLIDMDLCPRYPNDYHGVEYIKYRFSRKLKTIAENKYVYEDNSAKRYRHERFMWRLRLFHYYKEMLRDADAVIFCGGGFLKFRTQGLNYYVEMVTEIAEKYGIPVMMNGVGIEGYDEEDIRCRQLKKHINMSCVKMITTRDDIDTLNDNYIGNKDIITSRVGDPALWTPECYDISRDKEAKKIGINVIRGEVYRDYGNSSSADSIKKFYMDLIRGIEKKGFDWVMFSNGMPEDQKMGELLIRSMDLSEDKLLPAPKTPEDMLKMIKKFKCVFGARLHACITAYALDIPVTGLIWNEKTRIFADIIDKHENFFEEDEMSAERIIEAIEYSNNISYDVSKRNELKNITKKYIDQFLGEILK